MKIRPRCPVVLHADEPGAILQALARVVDPGLQSALNRGPAKDPMNIRILPTMVSIAWYIMDIV